MKRPWMPLYIADYLKDTTHLGALESGAYLHLIMDYWQNGKLPNDERKLARIARLTDREWKASRETLKGFFHDGWKHKRIDGEIQVAARIAESNADKARDAANKRWAARNSEMLGAMPQACPEQCSDDATTDAPECTLHTSHFTEKEIGGASAPDETVVPLRRYVFEGRIIRLEQAAFDRWKKAYHAIPDFTAALQAADDYYSENPPKDGKWFFPVSRWLEKEHSKITAEEEKQRREARSF
jgi:uncharacterized protein YdaU (DUF1376 family)